MPRRPLSAFSRAQASGSRAAAREHARLGTNQTRQVDIFSIVEDAGIWLMFQPMRNLYGAYLREDDGIGIIVNSNHPLSVRRFTAAHEYGHHVLGHDSVLDGEHDIHSFSQTGDLQEVAAQAFAADFLMPLQLVNIMLRQMGLAPGQGSITATQVYLLSLNLGSSYPATISRLKALGKISHNEARSLRREQPKTLKASIGRGHRPPQVWADSWHAGPSDSGRTLYPKVDDMLHITLPEVPSSGFMWSVEDTGIIDLTSSGTHDRPDNAFLALDASTFEGTASGGEDIVRSQQSITYGAGGVRHLTFRVLRSGEVRLRVHYRRPWQASDPVHFYELDLRIMSAGTGGTEQGLSTHQWPKLAEAA